MEEEEEEQPSAPSGPFLPPAIQPGQLRRGPCQLQALPSCTPDAHPRLPAGSGLTALHSSKTYPEGQASAPSGVSSAPGCTWSTSSPKHTQV